jgi:hypothetical protein
MQIIPSESEPNEICMAAASSSGLSAHNHGAGSGAGGSAPAASSFTKWSPEPAAGTRGDGTRTMPSPQPTSRVQGDSPLKKKSENQQSENIIASFLCALHCRRGTEMRAQRCFFLCVLNTHVYIRTCVYTYSSCAKKCWQEVCFCCRHVAVISILFLLVPTSRLLKHVCVLLLSFMLLK